MEDSKISGYKFEEKSNLHILRVAHLSCQLPFVFNILCAFTLTFMCYMINTLVYNIIYTYYNNINILNTKHSWQIYNRETSTNDQSQYHL